MRGLKLVVGLCVAVLLLGSLATRPIDAQNPAIMFAWNGTGNQTPFTSSLANLIASTTTTARNNTGSLLAEKGGRWTVVSQPAANSQATASIAAEAAVRHVVDCVSFSADAAAAVTAAAGTFVVRDGATGAGTVIWSYAVAHLVAAGAGIQTIAPHSICGLNLVGTTNTAMTAEFNAGVTGEVQGASISGYNVN